jgi:transcriptional regulator with XRE-family HTH domain
VSLAERIRHVRRERLALTQRELADKLGVADVVVSRWERGVAEPQLRHLRHLAELAGEPVSWFFAESEAARA